MQMLPSSHQLAHFFAVAKIHKLENINDVTIDNLKLRPIIDQTRKSQYRTGKVIQFPSTLNNVSLSENEEDVSYNVESLFTDIPMIEVIDLLCDKVYNCKRLIPICKQSIFKKLLYKLTLECTFSVTAKLIKLVVLLWVLLY